MFLSFLAAFPWMSFSIRRLQLNPLPNRKALAVYCHQQVAHGIEQSLKGREIVPPMETLKLQPA